MSIRVTLGAPVSSAPFTSATYASEGGRPALPRQSLPPTRGEELERAAGLGIGERAHVLHHAQHRHTDPLEHARATKCVTHGELLGRSHNDGARYVRRLNQRELRITRTRREVDNEVVQGPPID